MRAALALAGVVFSFAVASVAQQSAAPRVSPFAPIRILLDGARKPGDCASEGKLLQAELADLRFPPGWTLAIMCTAVRWETVLQQVNPPYTHDAFTRRSARITV